MSNRALISDAHQELSLSLRRMKFLTNLLTREDGQALTSDQKIDLCFWLDALVDEGQTFAGGLGDAISNIEGERK